MKTKLSLISGAIMLPMLAAAQNQKPNILFILADDLGYPEVSCNGFDLCKTPNIDRLAENGMRFTNGYTAPLSGPSRAMLQTGRYPFRTGGTNQNAVGDMITPQSEIFIPKVLNDAGYVTTAIGKWGQLPQSAHAFGYHDWLLFKSSGVYWNYQKAGKSYDVNGTQVPLKDGEYLPDMMQKHLFEFLKKNRSKPFFVYYSLSHIHADILPTPDSKKETTDVNDLYVDNIVYMDKLVGQLMEELKRLNLFDNTMVIFMGDNGTAEHFADIATIGGRRLAGEKGSMLEGGSLVPLIVQWPKVVKKGQVSHSLIVSTDLFPTFVAVAGAKMPKGVISDGVNFLPILKGDNSNERKNFFMQLANMYYVRSKDYKLNEKGELYDMKNAPFEEILIDPAKMTPKEVAAKKELQTELARLNPKGGYIDKGDGSGRNANRANKKGKDNSDE